MEALHTMVKQENLAKVAVVGLGQTGLSCYRWLKKQGVTARLIDTREHLPVAQSLLSEDPTLDIRTGALNPEMFVGIEQIVLSPGLSLKDPVISQCIAAGVEVVGDIELFARLVEAPVVAITGSNGKTTVTTLLGEMAKRAGKKVAVGGNIGVPVLDLLSQNDFELYVLELSSFQLETTSSLKPVAAVVLNVSEDHMDRYHHMEDYSEAKQLIYHNAKFCVVNRDDERVVRMPCSGKVVSFGLRDVVDGQYGLLELYGEIYLAKGKQALLSVSELKLEGKHNWANALACLALGEKAGIDIDSMLDTLKEFSGLPHRVQRVAEQNGVLWINDSKATNVGACIAAVSGMSGPVVLIAGGEGKGQDFEPLREVFEKHVKALILIGRDAPLIEKVAGTAHVVRAMDMESAVSVAYEIAESGDTVLLSPACASFDMFNNYQHRGDVFVEAVNRMLANAG